jgi:hypothetical protein
VRPFLGDRRRLLVAYLLRQRRTHGERLFDEPSRAPRIGLETLNATPVEIATCAQAISRLLAITGLLTLPGMMIEPADVVADRRQRDGIGLNAPLRKQTASSAACAWK